MFRNLMNFNYQRKLVEAIGFYIAYVLLGLIIAGLSGGIAALFNPYVDAYSLGSFIGLIYSLIIYFLIYYKKKINSFIYLLLGLITGFLSILVGIFVSFIIVAFLTTREDKSNVDSVNDDNEKEINEDQIES